MVDFIRACLRKPPPDLAGNVNEEVFFYNDLATSQSYIVTSLSSSGNPLMPASVPLSFHLFVFSSVSYFLFEFWASDRLYPIVSQQIKTFTFVLCVPPSPICQFCLENRSVFN